MGQRLGLLGRPRGQEELLQLCNDRALELQIGVAPGGAAISGLVSRALAEGPTGIDAADVDTSQERDASIDDQQLAVIVLV